MTVDGRGTDQGGAEPIAVVGIGCRFPGDAGTPDAFWELLQSGRNTTAEVPAERWEPYEDLGPQYASVLRNTVRRGSFLSRIDEFDPEFFGISPREAELMDPQQRLLLEVAWEALEHAGIPPASLAGTETGVFVGACTDDYRRHLLEDLATMDAWSGIGAARCAVANRISHVLDLRGPSLAVDTACSASLVALHLACQSLRLEESSVALVGGVNLLVSPGETVTLDLAGALAADGRSKAFDASGDGYGRGEGCGVVVLKRLRDARRDGDRVLALIRGSAVNQDGLTPGIMAPSATAQEHVMVRACRDAGIDPASVGYVEAHGTGTLLGDPLEASALSAVYGAGRDGSTPCLVGSVKSNIGHLEGAAGIAGVIKTVLALNRAEIPATPLVTEPNPAIPWDSCGLRLTAEHTAWPATGAPRQAGVSGFGYGGTVAHVVLEQAPETSPAAAGPEPFRADTDTAPRLYAVSAASDEALSRRADDLASWLSGPGTEVPLTSLGHTLALRRSHLARRATVAAAGREELLTGLRALADDEPAEAAVTGSVLHEPGPGLVWVFSGHGSQWAGMGRELLACEPDFASVIDALDPVFAEEIGFSPRQVLLDDDLTDVARVQTMIFAMQVGLAAVWRSRGVTPHAVIGHSVGEIAAAVTAGALTLEDGARLICRRSLLLRRVAGRGAMAMAGLPFDDVERRLAGRTDAVAAIRSSPMSTVLAGDTVAVEALVAAWQAEGVVVRRVACDVAFHSPHMDPLLDELADAAVGLTPSAAQLPVYRTALEDPRSSAPFDGAYWVANLRNPVRLADAVAAAAADGYRAFLEVSPHPVVSHSVSETLSHEGIGDAFVGSTLRRDRPERRAFLSAVGAVHCHGLAVDWDRLHPHGDLADVPAYPWRRRRLWHTPQLGGSAGEREHDTASHTLLGSATAVVGSRVRLWRTWLDDTNRPYPGSHTINGVEIVPATVLVNSFFRAVSPEGPPPTLTGVSMRQPLMTAERREIQVVREGDALRLASRAADAGEEAAWLTHAAAESADPAPLPATPACGTAVAGTAALERVATTLVHERLSAVGVPSTGFTWTIEELFRGEPMLRGTVAFPPAERTSWAPVLDAAMTLAPVAYPGPPVLRMVTDIAEITVRGEPPEAATIDVAVSADRDDAVDVTVTAPSGEIVAAMTGLVYAVIGAAPTAPADPRHLVHEVAWRPHDISGTPDVAAHGVPGGAVLLGPRTALTAELVDRLQAAGRDCLLLDDPDALGEDGLGEATDVLLTVAPADPATPSDEAAARHAWLLIRTVRRLLTLGPRSTRLWCLTTGAVRTGTGEEAGPDPALAALTGIGRVVAGAHGDLFGGVIDADASDPGTTADALLGVLDHAQGAPREDVVALRDGAALVPRLTRVTREPDRAPLACRADGTYLVAGEPSPLGLEVAGRLADLGARRIVFAGPRPFPARSAWDSTADEQLRHGIDGVRALEAAGVTVRVLQLDITDADQAARLREPDLLELPAIRGIVHLTEPDDEPKTADLDEAALRAAIRPRAAGAWTLHQLFPPGELDFIAFVTSADQLLNLPGRPGDGAASAFIDALALQRSATADDRTLSLGCLSVSDSGGDDQPGALSGASSVTPADALAAWEFAENRGTRCCAVLRTTAPAPAERPLPLLSETGADASDDASDGDDASQGWDDDLAGAAPDELHAHLVDEVRAQIAKEMKLPATDLDTSRSLAEQGLDSILTIMVRRRLEKRFRHSLPATLLWQQPTVSAIASHLAELLTTSGEPERAPEEPAPIVAG